MSEEERDPRIYRAFGSLFAYAIVAILVLIGVALAILILRA